MRGELELAADAYRDAARGGHDPQPGLALLRMTQGDTQAAVAMVRRLRDEATDPAARARLLPALAEIMLAAGDHDAALEACEELELIVADRPSEFLTAAAAHARGAVALAQGDARAALPGLRRALAAWYELEAPLETARVRLLIADACRTLGDEQSAEVELEAARETFELLGVAPQIEAQRDLHGLTARELEVLRLVAGGHTNRAIADQLVLSERTVDRHVSNIFAKLRVASRAAATAYAYEHQLL
jgi:DNA-binding NarL/FixJ family response regulator